MGRIVSIKKFGTIGSSLEIQHVRVEVVPNTGKIKRHHANFYCEQQLISKEMISPRPYALILSIASFSLEQLNYQLLTLKSSKKHQK